MAHLARIWTSALAFAKTFSEAAGVLDRARQVIRLHILAVFTLYITALRRMATGDLKTPDSPGIARNGQEVGW